MNFQDEFAGIKTTEFVIKFIQQNPREAGYFAAAIKNYIKQHRAAVEQGLPPESVAYAFQLAVDREIANSDPADLKKVSCRRGCAHCCFIEVTITDEEAVELNLIVESFEDRLDWARVAHQAKVERYRQLAYKDRRCVFLNKQNECSVYEHRPINCRKYMVVSPPEECDSSRRPHGRVLNYVSKPAESMMSALYSAGDSGRLARQLLKFRKPKESSK